MIEKRFILVVFFLSMLFLIINLNFSSAAITVTKPVSNTNWSGSAMFNVTYVNATDFSNAINATFYYNASGIWTLLGTVNCGGNSTLLGYCNGTLAFPTLQGIFAINATLNNGTQFGNAWGATVLTTGVILDSRAPNVSTFYNTVAGGNYSGAIILNVSVFDGRAVDSVYFNITNSSGNQINYTKASASGGYYNFTLNTSGVLPDGLYNITVYANDTGTNNLNSSQRIQVLLDNTAPTATFSCSPASTTVGQTVTCTCTPSDALSGINTSYVSAGLDFSLTPDTQTVQSNTPLTCKFYDLAGNLGTETTNYTITAAPLTNNPANSATVPSQTSTNILTKITTSNISIMSNFASFGINEIRINVSTEANNVQVSVTKYDSKPSAVSVNKTGNVFAYLQIQTQNLVTHLNTATLKIQVNKTWISGNYLTKNDIVLFKYNESSNKWGGLTTTFINEDSTYDYYETELQSFSYFAIGQKDVVTTQSSATGTNETTPKKDLTWLWTMLVGIVVVVILVLAFLLIKRKTY